MLITATSHNLGDVTLIAIISLFSKTSLYPPMVFVHTRGTDIFSRFNTYVVNILVLCKRAQQSIML